MAPKVSSVQGALPQLSRAESLGQGPGVGQEWPANRPNLWAEGGLGESARGLVEPARLHPGFASTPELCRACWTFHVVSCLCHLALTAHSVLLKMPFSLFCLLGKLLFIHQNPD